jgi:gluconolactonase
VKRAAILFVFLYFLAWPQSTVAQTPSQSSIVKLDPALDELISPDAKLEIIKENYYTNAEGPAWVQQGKTGFLVFSDVTLNLIQKFDPGCQKKFPCPIESGKASVYMEHDGYTQAELDAGKVSVPNHDGTVGLEVDPQGRIVAADYGEHGIVRFEKDGKRTMVAGTYMGKKFSCPNKLVVKSNGAIFFTDAVTTCIKGGDNSPERELDYHGLFVVKNGNVTLLAKDPQGGAPHGIAMSPNEKVLYVGIGKKILAYDINSDDTVSNERIFLDLAAEKGGVDGINVDSKGNVWAAGPGGIWIVSPQGKHLGTISAPAVQGIRFANCAFGDPDRKTLYIVGNKNLWRIRLKVAGIKKKS